MRAEMKSEIIDDLLKMAVKNARKVVDVKELGESISGGHFVDPLFSYMLMVNKLAGTPLSETCETVNLNFVNLESVEDAVNYYTYVEGDTFPYNEEEIRSMVKYFNPDMTIDKLREIADAYSVDDVVERHGE